MMFTIVRMRRCLLGNVLALVALLTGTTAAHAMRVSPMVLEMESRGGDAVARIEVENVNQGRLAFETRVYRLEFDEAGEITEVPADDQFVVFPPQGVLPAGGRQVVRLQWVGAPDIAASQAFYVSVNQLPVQLAPGSSEESRAQVQMVYHMRALAVVAPPGATPDVEAMSVRKLTYQPPTRPGADAPPSMVEGVEVVLRNTGRRHEMMANFGWRFQGFNEAGERVTVTIPPDELNAEVGTGYVPALGDRTFLLSVGGFASDEIELGFVE